MPRTIESRIRLNRKEFEIDNDYFDSMLGSLANLLSWILGESRFYNATLFEFLDLGHSGN